MKLIESFSLTQIGDVLRDALSVSEESDLEFSFSSNGDVLNVTFQGLPRQYLLLLLKAAAPVCQQTNGQCLLQPNFTLEDKLKNTYGAFSMEHLRDFVIPEHNKLDQLRVILRTLAQIQANGAIETSTAKSEYPLNEITELLEYFKSIETVKITLEDLQTTFNELLKSTFLVKSVWSPCVNSVYINKDNASSLLLDISSRQPVPPAYDAFLYIFTLSDEHFRQKHFEDLTSFYFKSLEEALEAQNNNLYKEVTRSYAERQLKNLLPIVKLKVLAETKQSPQQFKEILANLTNFFQYPLIQQEDVYQAIKSKLSSDDYTLLSYKLVPLSVKNGHLGEYFHLTILVRFKDKEESLNLFAKFIIGATEMTREIVEQRGVVKKEDFFYSTLYSLFQNQGLEDILDFAPKCYLSRLSGSLILEDLTSLNYISLKPNVLLDKNGIVLVLQQLAKLHASSFILEELLSKQQARTYRLDEEYAEYFKESIIRYEGAFLPWYDGAVDAISWSMNKFPDLTENLGLTQENLREKLKTIILSPFSRIKKSDTVRNVVNHGDMYISNMLFKFESCGRTVEDVVLIDFQILRYIPPAYEMLFFIFLNSTKETRDKHFPSLLDTYYNTLSNKMREFNLDPEEIYSRENFENDIKYIKPASLGMAFIYGHLTHIDPDFREEIMHDQEKNQYYMVDHQEKLLELSWKEEHYRRLLRGLMEDFVDLIKA